MRGRDARRDSRRDAGARTLKAENYRSKRGAGSEKCSYVTLRFISRF